MEQLRRSLSLIGRIGISAVCVCVDLTSVTPSSKAAADPENLHACRASPHGGVHFNTEPQISIRTGRIPARGAASDHVPLDVRRGGSIVSRACAVHHVPLDRITTLCIASRGAESHHAVSAYHHAVSASHHVDALRGTRFYMAACGRTSRKAALHRVTRRLHSLTQS